MTIEIIVSFTVVHPAILHLRIEQKIDIFYLISSSIIYLKRPRLKPRLLKKDEILVEFSVVELKEAYEKQQILFQEPTTLEEIEDTRVCDTRHSRKN